MQILPSSATSMTYAFMPPAQAKGGRDSERMQQNSGQEQDEKALTTHQRDSNPSSLQNAQMDSQQARVLAQLKAADREVRAHEAAHMAAGGALAGGASYTYKTGPDGQQYAVAGEVPINMSKGRTPEQTIERANQVRAAALAPAQPSAQDYKVAQSAEAMKRSAQVELLKLKQEEMKQQVEQAKAENPIFGKEEQARTYQTIQNPAEPPTFSAVA